MVVWVVGTVVVVELIAVVMLWLFGLSGLWVMVDIFGCDTCGCHYLGERPVGENDFFNYPCSFIKFEQCSKTGDKATRLNELNDLSAVAMRAY